MNLLRTLTIVSAILLLTTAHRAAAADAATDEGAAVSEKLENVRAIARSNAGAREETASSAPDRPSMPEGRPLQLWAVGLTCFFLGGVVFFKGKQLRRPGTAGKPLQILSRTALTPKSSLIWVRSQDEELLLAAGPEPVTLLMRRAARVSPSFNQELLSLNVVRSSEEPVGDATSGDEEPSFQNVAGV